MIVVGTGIGRIVGAGPRQGIHLRRFLLMFRSTLCIAAMLGAGSALRAGELDGDKSVQKFTPAATISKVAATELDGETPTPAHRRGGWGYGGFGGGYRGGYGNSFGFGRGFGYGGGFNSFYGNGFGNYGGYQGYSNYYGGYSSYYAPSFVSYPSYGYYPNYYGGGCW